METSIASGARVDELVAARLTEGPRFHELMTTIDASGYAPYLHRALMNLENARSGDPTATRYVLAALWKIQNVVTAAAEIEWRKECEEIAERRLT